MRRISTQKFSVPVLQKLVLSTLVLCSVIAANAATFTSRVSGDWNLSTTWTVSGGTDADGVPDADDVVTIGQGHIVTVPASYIGAAQSLTLGSANPGGGSSGRLNFSANSELTVSGNVSIGVSGSAGRFGVIDMTNGGRLRTGTISVQQTSSVLNAGTGTIEFTGTGNIPTQLATFNNLVINGGATTAQGPLAVNGNFSILSGTFNAGSFTHSVAGNWTNTGTFNAGTSTINFNGTGAQSIGSSNFYSVNFTNTGVKTATGSLDIAEDVTIGSNFSGGSFTHFVGGDWNNSGTFNPGTSTINFDAATGVQNIFKGPFYNVVASNGGTRIVAGDLDIEGNLSILGGTFDLDGANVDRNDVTGGVLTLGAGALLEVGGTNTLPLYGAYNINPTSTVIYDGTTQNIAAVPYGNLTLQGIGATKTLPSTPLTIAGDLLLSVGTIANANGPITINGDVNLGEGSILNAGPYNHFVRGDWNNNTGNIANFNANGGTITFDGSAAQIIDGNTTSTFNNLTINNAAGITLSQPETVTGVLTLTNGILVTTSNALLTLNDGATVVRTDPNNTNTAFVSGPVQKIGDDAFVFPVGRIGFGYHPISISAPGAVTDAFTAEYIRANAMSLGPITAEDLTRVSGCDYWNLTRTSGSSAVDVTLSWNTQTHCGVDDPIITQPFANIVAAKFNGTSWDRIDNEGLAGDPLGSGFVTLPNVTTFVSFALGTTRSEIPLPVTFVSIEAKAVANGTQVSWKVADQIDVLRYEVERSSNGVNFSTIGAVPAADVSAYAFIDRTPASGTVYYRVKNVDVDGRFKYSTIVSLRNGVSSAVVKAFPIPARNTITLQHELATDKTRIQLVTQDGRLLKAIRPAAGTMQTGIDLSDYAPGVYILSYDRGNGAVENIKVVKQ